MIGELLGIAATVVINAVIIGIAWGNLTAQMRVITQDMDDVRKALGLKDGGQGRFLGREEFKMAFENSQREHSEFRDRIKVLESERS